MEKESKKEYNQNATHVIHVWNGIKMRENASEHEPERHGAKEIDEKNFLNIFWFHFVFLSFYFCFLKVSHQPNIARKG